MKLLVCGGRDYLRRTVLWAALDNWWRDFPDLRIICGYDPHRAKWQGADQLAYNWAKATCVPVDHFPADWNKYGRSAGPRRNSEMLAQKPDRVLAAPRQSGSLGEGTEDTLQKAKAAGIPIAYVPGFNFQPKY